MRSRAIGAKSLNEMNPKQFAADLADEQVDSTCQAVLGLTAGCDAGGRLTAVRARFAGDSGAYASVGMKVLERAAGHACGPYRVPHVDVESVAAYTNHPPCGAMRGW